MLSMMMRAYSRESAISTASLPLHARSKATPRSLKRRSGMVSLSMASSSTYRHLKGGSPVSSLSARGAPGVRVAPAVGRSELSAAGASATALVAAWDRLGVWGELGPSLEEDRWEDSWLGAADKRVWLGVPKTVLALLPCVVDVVMVRVHCAGDPVQEITSPVRLSTSKAGAAAGATASGTTLSPRPVPTRAKSSSMTDPALAVLWGRRLTRISKVVPFPGPGESMYRVEPAWRSRSLRTMTRPTPVPPLPWSCPFPTCVKILPSRSTSSSSAVRPAPESTTRSTTRS
mmetsp:Transcript_17074/g.46154  ORF Transcript_17074/g.46154 Transcript_17074/m.46154 type:complete len:288 (+) Transcript_17074:435-1298(+)